MSDTKNDSYDLDSNGIFLFSEVVDSESCGDAMHFVLERNLDTEAKHKHLTMIINSPGGYVNDGFALIDIMAGSRLPIHTVGIGILASMGLVIFMSGKKGFRTLTPNAVVLSHQWSGGNYGKSHELIASQKHHTILNDIFMRHYKKHTGLSEKKIKEYLLPSQDVWLTAKEALDLGICDQIKDLN
jgi:ATP-dependent Clp protease protease subunit